MEAGLWVIRFYFHSSLLQKATCCSPRMLPVSHALTQSLHWASLMDRKGEKSSIYLPHWDIIRWFGMDGCSFGPEAITDPSKTVHANPRAATIWEGYRKSNRKTTRAGKVLKNPTRSEYIGRKTIPWKKTQMFLPVCWAEVPSAESGNAQPEPNSLSQKHQVSGSCAKPWPGDLDL